MRDHNKALQLDLDDYKQKLSDAQGDIKVSLIKQSYEEKLQLTFASKKNVLITKTYIHYG